MERAPHEISHIKDILQLRLKMKTDRKFAEAVRSALYKVTQDNSLQISKDAIDLMIVAHPEEVASRMPIGSLPVGSQCQVDV